MNIIPSMAIARSTGTAERDWCDADDIRKVRRRFRDHVNEFLVRKSVLSQSAPDICGVDVHRSLH